MDHEEVSRKVCVKGIKSFKPQRAESGLLLEGAYPKGPST